MLGCVGLGFGIGMLILGLGDLVLGLDGLVLGIGGMAFECDFGVWGGTDWVCSLMGWVFGLG